MVWLLNRLKSRKNNLKNLIALHKIRRIAVFGSYAAGTQTRSSDVDFLVDFKKDADLLDQSGLKIDLQEMLGKKVDVVTPGSLSKYLRAKILKEAVYL